MLNTSLNRLWRGIKAADGYAVTSLSPKLAFDFNSEYYRTNGGQKSFSNAMTFARAGLATMVDSDGKIKWAPHNLFTESENIADSDWTKSGATATQVTTTLPDGTSGTASRVQDTGGGTVYQTDPVVVGQKYTVAIWAKRNGATDQTFRLFLDGLLASSDLTATEDWQLFEYETTITTGGTVSFGFTDNSSGSDNYDIIFWGAHLYRSDLGGMVNNPDRGDSYVPTTSSAVYLPRRGHHKYNGDSWVNKGILAESEARTNLVEYSNFSSGWNLANSSIDLNNATSPDGSTNAVKLKVKTSSTFHAIYDVVAGGTYHVSVFAKAGEYDGVQLTGSNTIYDHACFNLVDGTAYHTGSNASNSAIQDVGNGWYRCSATIPVTNGNIYIAVTDGASTSWLPVFSGANTTDGIYIYGAQLEAASTPSSYIPTNGATVTRAAETVTVPYANLPWPTPQYIGDELVTNGTFDTDSDWNKGAGWSIGSGVASSDGSQVSNSALSQAVSTTVGKTYKISLDISSYTQGEFQVWAYNSSGTTNGNIVTSGGVYTLIFTAVGSSTSILLYARAGGTPFIGSIDNVSVREINPLSVSIAMMGEMDYSDDDNSNQVVFLQWQLADAQNEIVSRLNTNAPTGSGGFQTFQYAAGVLDIAPSTVSNYSPDLNVPFNIASRHGSTFINGAVDGTALTADTTPVALPDLSTTNLNLAYDFMGTISTFRMWDRDLGDTGIAKATE